MFSTCTNASTLTYNMFLTCTNASTLTYNMFATCTNASTLTYNMFSTCTNASVLIYNLFSICTSASTLIYNMFSTCTNVSTLTYNMLFDLYQRINTNLQHAFPVCVLTTLFATRKRFHFGCHHIRSCEKVVYSSLRMLYLQAFQKMSSVSKLENSAWHKISKRRLTSNPEGVVNNGDRSNTNWCAIAWSLWPSFLNSEEAR